MNPKEIAAEARRSLGSYCFEECKSYCCRKGYLSMTEKEMETVTKERKEEFKSKGMLKKQKNGSYSLYIGSPKGCPGIDIKTLKCTIHNNPNRPKMCKLFPVFISGNEVYLSQRCPAVKEGKLYPYVARLVKAGLKYKRCDSFIDADCFNLKQ